MAGFKAKAGYFDGDQDGDQDPGGDETAYGLGQEGRQPRLMARFDGPDLRRIEERQILSR